MGAQVYSLWNTLSFNCEPAPILRVRHEEVEDQEHPEAHRHNLQHRQAIPKGTHGQRPAEDWRQQTLLRETQQSIEAEHVGAPKDHRNVETSGSLTSAYLVNHADDDA